METIRKIKLAHGREERSIRRIARDFHLSRNTVRKVIRSEATTFEYCRAVQPMLRMAGFISFIGMDGANLFQTNVIIKLM